MFMTNWLVYRWAGYKDKERFPGATIQIVHGAFSIAEAERVMRERSEKEPKTLSENLDDCWIYAIVGLGPEVLKPWK